MRELLNDVGLVQSLAPAVISATATGAAIDLAGYQSALVIVNTGAIVSAGDFAISIEESDTTTGGDFAAAAAADVLGTVPATLEAASIYKLAYIGNKQYIRTVFTKAGGTSIAAGIVVAKGHALTGPVA